METLLNFVDLTRFVSVSESDKPVRTFRSKCTWQGVIKWWQQITSNTTNQFFTRANRNQSNLQASQRKCCNKPINWASNNRIELWGVISFGVRFTANTMTNRDSFDMKCISSTPGAWTAVSWRNIDWPRQTYTNTLWMPLRWRTLTDKLPSNSRVNRTPFGSAKVILCNRWIDGSLSNTLRRHN